MRRDGAELKNRTNPINLKRISKVALNLKRLPANETDYWNNGAEKPELETGEILNSH